MLAKAERVFVQDQLTAEATAHKADSSTRIEKYLDYTDKPR
jgi:hypothetical protein